MPEAAARSVLRPLPCRSKTVLIIGGSGFLGTELIRQATVAGHETAATFATTRPGTISGVTWLPLDVRDPAQVAG